ncbi:MAG: patatin-like phospholipase family protein [Bdellovibrionia bacterium]
MKGDTSSREERIKIGPKRKIAFVCSGGATKAGAFHLGVALALQEQGFKFFGGMAPVNGPAPKPGPMDISLFVGSSAGSIISSYLAAGYSLDNIVNSFLGKTPTEADRAFLTPKELPRLTYQKMFKIKPNLGMAEQLGQLKKIRKSFSELLNGDLDSFLQFKWFKMSGIFSTHGIEQYMREEVLLSNRFQDYLADLFIVGTQLNHSRKVVFGKFSYQPPPHDLTCQYENDVGISEACAASTALPVIFSPYPIRTRNQLAYYIDGEIRDTLSSHIAVDGGADLVIASYTHQPLHVSHDPSALINEGIPAIMIQSIYLLIEQKINNHIFNKTSNRNAIDAVSKYCRQEGISDAHRQRICEILEVQLNYRMDIDTIYIHPSPSDAQLFYGEHFSLSPKKMADMVKSGFQAAIAKLRQYEFADRVKTHAIGVTDSG